VTQSTTNYEKVLAELATTNRMIQNLTDVIDRQNTKISTLDQRFILSLIRIKNEFVLSSNRSVRYHEEVLKRVQQVKEEIMDFFLSNGEIKKEREEVEEHGADIVNGTKGEFSDFEKSQPTFLERMTLNFKDGKLILVLSAEPAPIAFVCTIIFTVIAILLAVFFCLVWICKRFCCKHCSTPNQRQSENEVENGFEMKSSSFRYKKGSRSRISPSPLPLSPPSPNPSIESLPLPPPPPPLHTSTPKPIPKKETLKPESSIPKTEPLSLKDAIPKLKPDGTTYTPSEIISLKRKNSIPKTRAATKIVNGELRVVGQVLESSL
jgi:hypothetical protein